MKTLKSLLVLLLFCLVGSTMAAPGLDSLSGKVGIWFFYMSDCPYCAKTEPILYELSKQYNIPVTSISLDGGPTPNQMFTEYIHNKGQAERLGVLATPTLYLVNPSTGEATEISQGYLDAEALKTRMVSAASIAGWLDENVSVDTTMASPLKGQSTQIPQTQLQKNKEEKPLFFDLR